MAPRGSLWQMKISVRPYSSPAAPKSKWVVRFPFEGKPRKRYFQTKVKAEFFASKQRNLLDRAGVDAANLSPTLLRDVIQCISRLQPTGAGLTDAVEFYVTEWEKQRTHRSITFRDALTAFLGDKEREGLRPRSLSNLRIRLANFGNGLGDKPLSEIKKEACTQWLDFGTARTRINRRAVLNTFFAWAEGEGYCENLVARIPKPKVDDHEPELLALPQCHRLMEAAQSHRGGEWVPYHALTLFCAIRPTEAERLAWDAIDIEERTVTISGREAKMRARRTIPIADNALDWLLPHLAKGTLLCPPGAAKNLRAIHKSAGIDPWPQDAPRHTCISAWMQLYGEAKAATWAGNSPDVCHKFYKGRMSTKNARALFSIRPLVSATVEFQNGRFAS